MLYERLVEAYEQISETSKRTEMTRILVEVLREAPPDLIDTVVYLTRGNLYPDFVPIEMGMAERLALKSVAIATGATEEQVASVLASTGDLGLAAEDLLAGRKGKEGGRGGEGARQNPPSPRLTVEEVYRRLDEIARSSGKGSVAAKIDLLAGLLARATPVEAKYLVRTATGKLRLGVADMTILDALAAAYGEGKSARQTLEHAYNLCSDLGAVAAAVARGGLRAAERFHLQPGKPVRPMLAQRMRSPGEILSALGGRCEAEYKYDGERLQVHKMGNELLLFSRRLEDVTHQYPDVARLVLSQLKARDAILEGEAVAVDPDTGDLLPFQELMHRRRKYDIQEMMSRYPATFYAFDMLYLDGRDLMPLPFPDRRGVLMESITASERLQPIPGKEVGDAEELEAFFHEAIEAGCEGLVCKSLKPDSTYQAGSRGWNWIKYKREYVSEMTDSVDLVVVGALHGRGRRGGAYGALLLAAYDPESDSFPTVTKCGAGFTDADLADLPGRLAKYRIDHRHPRVDARMKADVWFVPGLVLEVIGAEITLSPIHTVDWGVVKPDAGLAIRFPRFTGRYRPDKSPEDATTAREILEMYRSRLKRANP